MARIFHQHYEQLAPQFDCPIYEELAKPWNELSEANREMMIAVSTKLLKEEPNLGGKLVAVRRLDALKEAIRQRTPWDEIEWHYDHARSAVDKALGADRGRATDKLRAEEALDRAAEAAYLARTPGSSWKHLSGGMKDEWRAVARATGREWGVPTGEARKQ